MSGVFPAGVALIPRSEARLGTIQLASGGYFDFNDPSSSPIRVRDIAAALSRICRYTGHCRQFYSVAQHSVLASRYAPEMSNLPLRMLLHDAPEAYIGDMNSPLKSMLPQYKAIERAVSEAVEERFDCGYLHGPAVKEVDLRMLATEVRDLMPDPEPGWGVLEGIEPYPDAIEPWSPEKAELEFSLRYLELSDR